MKQILYQSCFCYVAAKEYLSSPAFTIIFRGNFFSPSTAAALKKFDPTNNNKRFTHSFGREKPCTAARYFWPNYFSVSMWHIETSQRRS